MDNRWAIHIDIEGFSALYPQGNDALWALNKLMLAIHGLGKHVYPEPPDRLFVYQLGGGFLIVSDCHEENLDRAVSIATVLMKFISRFGIFSRAAIAEGEISDIKGCYSDEVMNDCDEGDWPTSSMGAGLMTIFPVMGTALINAVGIDKISPKGPLITMPTKYLNRISSEFVAKEIPDSELVSIDWVHSELTKFSEIATKASLKYPSPDSLENLIKRYIEKHQLPGDWKDSCSIYLGVVHA